MNEITQGDGNILKSASEGLIFENCCHSQSSPLSANRIQRRQGYRARACPRAHREWVAEQDSKPSLSPAPQVRVCPSDLPS